VGAEERYTEMTQPLFFKVIDRASPETARFINAAHVVKIEIESAKLSGGSLYLQDGSTVEIGPNEAEWIMKLMGVAFDEQLKAINTLYTT
jgi:hypothetical protein